MTNLMSAAMRLKARPGASGQRGFTLMELMIVVGIIAVLAAVAYNSYEGSVVKSRRKAAAGCVTEAAQYMERYYATNMRYDQDQSATPVPVGVLTPAKVGCMNDVTPNYALSLSTTVPATATTYLIEAVPKAPQSTKDAKCGTLQLDQAGTRAITGTGGSAEVQNCWQ